MAEIEERIGRPADIEILTETVAVLTAAVQTLNDVVLVLASKLDETDIPHWETKEEIEQAVGEKVRACVNAVRRVDGHSKTDKS